MAKNFSSWFGAANDGELYTYTDGLLNARPSLTLITLPLKDIKYIYSSSWHLKDECKIH